MDIDTDTDEEFVDHYNNDPLLPIYKPLTTGIKTKEAISLLLRPLKPDQLSRNIPLDINRNVPFVYSIQNIGHWKNALCDGMGRWNQTGTETGYYNIDGNLKAKSLQEVDAEHILVTRRKYVNASYNKLHRIQIDLENTATNEILDQIFVQYYFVGEERAVKIAPHGNSKSERSFIRTTETTKQRIQDLCKSKSNKAKDIFHTVLEEQGGLSGAKGGAYIARNRQQIRNFKRQDKETNTDPIIECSDLAKSQELSQSRFLREVRSAPEFTMFLASDRQLEDISKFCTDEEAVSVLGVDTTFNIGQYYVTITTYRHLMLTNEFGVEPVMIGPILLHQRKSFDSYFKLSSSILQNCPDLKNLRVFGTDGDVNLGHAFAACFPKSAHLLCDLHMVDNVEKKLNQLNIKGKVAKQYLVDIFGSVSGNEKLKGLVDSMSEDELEENMENLREPWKSRHESGENFLTYFLENKYELIKQCMTADIRSLHGLGFPPKPFTQNGNECINAVMKADILSEKKGVKEKLQPFDFVKIAEQSVRRQENEVKLALLDKGEYHLKPAYQHLMVDEKLYWRKTEQQKEAFFKRFQNEKVGKDKVKSSDPVPSIMLSVREEVGEINSIPARTIREMFDAATSLNNEPGNIVHLPGDKDGKIYIVANKAKPTDPYMVKFAPSATTASCEKKCANTLYL